MQESLKFIIIFIKIVLSIKSTMAYTCTLYAEPFNFGKIYPNNNYLIITTINVTCHDPLFNVRKISYTVSLSKGFSNSYSKRVMKTKNNINNTYQVYINNQQNEIFGDGTSGTGLIKESYTTILGSQTKYYNISAFIKIPPNAIAGQYNDSLTLILNYK